MVSVIVPVYNGEREIEACLEAIRSQSGAALEILVIDDGSEDNTWNLCCKVARREPRIRLFRQKNSGVSAARNRGLEEARGEFVLFVDSDDLLPPGAVEALQAAARTGADFVKGAHVLFRGKSREWVRPAPARISFPQGEEVPALETLASLVCGQLYRRSVLEDNKIRFLQGLPYGEDTVFNLTVFRHARQGILLDTAVYFRRKGGLASSVRYYPDRDEIALTLIRVYASYLRDRGAEAANVQRVIREEVSDAVSHYLIHDTKKTADKKAESILLRLRNFLPEELLPADSVCSGTEVLRQNRKKILLRKIKKTMYAARKKLCL